MLLHLLLLLLVLLLHLQPSSCDQWLDPSALMADAAKCYDISIPYPFGIMGDYSLGSEHLPSFGIICNGSAPMLPLPSGHYEIVNISLSEGTVTILGFPVLWHCPLNAVTRTRIPSTSLDFSLEGTPFTFSSTSNKFTAIGCDAMAMLEAANGSYLSACAAFCTSTDAIIEGLCSGVGCCQAPVPNQLKKLRLNFTSIRGKIGATKDIPWEPCSKTFLVKENEYVFTRDDLVSNADDENRPVVLEWSLGNDSCSDMVLCEANSYCYNSTNGIGYRCNCSKGFGGNPYLAPGCEDINECEEPHNPCVHPSRCKNTIGSFICTCPFGRSGDGTLQGTGCKKVAPLEFIISVGIGTGIGLLVIIQSLHVFIKRTKKRRRKITRERLFKQNHGLLLQKLISSNRDIGERLKIFTLEELEKATNKFDPTRVIGQGGHGIVYKGILSDQRVVAIKRSQFAIQREINEFINEVVILSQIDHRNVVKLYGCCLESEVPLLVYEFISNGTLFDHLHGEGYHILSWEERFWIMLEIARALAHLHSTASISVFHRDIKSSNVLLDDYLTAKVSDFGASRSIQIDKTGITTAVQGTYGYLDPEYYYTGRLTEKSDVYSFGVILAELLTRQKSVSSSKFREGENLAAHFCRAAREHNLVEILDTEITNEENLAKIEAVSIVAEICLRLKGEDRPTMKEVETRLEILNGSKKRQVLPQAAAKQAIIRDNLIRRNRSTGQNETSRIRSLEIEFLLSSDLPR